MVMSEKNRVTAQVKMEVEVDTLLLSNDKNSVIAEHVLSYFLCLRSAFEAQVARFGTKK